MRFPLRSLLLFAGSMFFLPYTSFSQPDFCIETRALISSLETYHYQPRTLDEAFSAELYGEVLLALDEDGIYFSGESLSDFSRYEKQLGNLLDKGSCNFFDSLLVLYRDRLQASLDYIDQWEATPIQQTVEHPEDTSLFAQTAVHWEQRWNSHLSLMSLRAYFRQQDSIPLSNKEAYEERISDYQAIACERARCEIRRLLEYPQGFEAYMGEVFLNQLTALYDPHSSYFSPLDKASFESSLDTEQASFGLSLEENEDGEVEIEWLTPGGPAWKSQVLNQGDIILGLQFEGDPPVDLSCIDLGAIQKMLDNGEGGKLFIQVRKNSGQTQEVELRREQVAVEENIVSGYVLEGDRKVGYIYLPGFYMSSEDEEEGLAMGCANDMAREILKLQLAGVEGLILDLRFNGGGSMSEAIGLAGIFLDQGPMSILEDRTEGISVLKDYNRGVMYGGPLLVMVNGMSASASELFAAVMQDYNRALVVGTPTFGKSTAQIILPLDYASSYSRAKGFVKVTNDKFFRVTGQTHQGKGVQPDIRLPEFWEGIVPQEWEYPRMLAATPVDKQPEFKALPDLPREQLNQLSSRRVASHPVFPKVKLLADSLGTLYDQVEMLDLDFETYRDLRLQQDRLYDSYDALTDNEITAFKAGNYPQREALLPFDEALAFRNRRSLKRIQTDVYIEEAYKVLLDVLAQP